MTHTTETQKADRVILITVSRGSIAKNLLDNAFFEILRKKYTLVIATPAYKDERFLAEYAREGVTFIDLPEVPFGVMDRTLFFFHKHLVFNSTVRQKMRWGIIGDPRSHTPTYVGFVVKSSIFSLLSRIHFLRDVVRWLDLHLTQKKAVSDMKQILDTWKPCMLISTHLADDAEVALVKAANELNIITIGFPKSWDNLSKHGFRVKPRYLVVWNEFMREQACEFQNYRKDEVFLVGVPQYDFNFEKDILLSREDFCALYGLDPGRKIILFGSEGKLFPSDTLVAECIADTLVSGALPPSSLLIRPHYGYKDDDKKFSVLSGREHVVVDLLNNPSPVFRDAWDYSADFTKRFVNGMYHADIVISTASTLLLDAACFDTPGISIAFNARTPLPYSQSVERWYETHYYRRILSYGASTVVRSPQELVDALAQYLTKPDTDHEARMRLRDAFTYRYDGHTGVRFAEAVSTILSSHSSTNSHLSESK